MYLRKILFTLSVIISFNCFSMDPSNLAIDPSSFSDRKTDEELTEYAISNRLAQAALKDDEGLNKYKERFRKKKTTYYEDERFFNGALSYGSDKAIKFAIKNRIRSLGYVYNKQVWTAYNVHRGLRINQKFCWGIKHIKALFEDTSLIYQDDYDTKIKRIITIFDCLKKYDPEFNQNMNRSSRSSMCQVLFHRYIKEDCHVDPKVITWIMNNTSNIQTALFSPNKSETKDSFLLSLAKKNFKNYSTKELVDIVISLDSLMKKSVKKELETVLLCLKDHNITIDGKKDEYVQKDMGDDKSLVTMQYAPRVPLKVLDCIMYHRIKEMHLAYNETNEYCANTQNPTALSKIVRQNHLGWKVFKK